MTLECGSLAAGFSCAFVAATPALAAGAIFNSHAPATLTPQFDFRMLVGVILRPSDEVGRRISSYES
jgi:hypothetical protein